MPHQAAPALSNDEQTLYVVVSSASTSTNRYLVGLNPSTLAIKQSSPGKPMRVALKDPRNGGANNASVSDDSSASPMVGPDGDVYYGVLEAPFGTTYRGWMLHFSRDLQQTKTPGAFGWDDTASLVPTAMVPGYAGPAGYLLFVKYNNYAGYDPNWEGGCCKFARVNGLTASGNYIHDNKGKGLWTDGDNFNIIFENNRIFQGGCCTQGHR